MQITNIKIGVRLGMAFAAIAALLIALSSISIMMLSKVNSGADAIVNDRMPKIERANAMLTNINDIAIALRNAMLSDNPDDRQKQREIILAQRRESLANLDWLNNNLKLPRSRELLGQMSTANEHYVQGQDALLKLIDSGTPEEAKAYLSSQLRPVLVEYKQAVSGLITNQNKAAVESGAAAAATYADTRQLIIALSIAILAISVVLA